MPAPNILLGNDAVVNRLISGDLEPAPEPEPEPEPEEEPEGE